MDGCKQRRKERKTLQTHVRRSVILWADTGFDCSLGWRLGGEGEVGGFGAAGVTLKRVYTHVHQHVHFPRSTSENTFSCVILFRV